MSRIDVLYHEAEVKKKRAEGLRDSLKNKEIALCTFQPTLHKNPRNIVPKYRSKSFVTIYAAKVDKYTITHF